MTKGSPERIHHLTQQIKARAVELGFEACGIAPAERLWREEPHLKEWLERDYHGEMAYMANHFDKRLDPTLLVEESRSVIVVLFNYYPPAFQNEASRYKVSKYACAEDYHLVLKEKLHQLGAFITEQEGEHRYRVFTDSAPVLEKAWAVQAGLGWQGKHSLLIVPRKGSFFFIGVLITSLELDYDTPFGGNLCGACHRCMQACPTGAIVAPQVVDSNKCLSYQTIELKDAELSESFREQNKEWIFGCDICQDACPWNRKPEAHHHADFQPNEALLALTDSDWENLTEEQFKTLFKDSAIQRTKYKGLMRNIRFLKEPPAHLTDI